MRAVPLLLLLLLSGCLAERTCQEMEPYEEIEYYNESLPYTEGVCINVTKNINRTDYSCSNFTYIETYNEEQCNERQVKYTFYSVVQTKVCDATFTPDVNWDPRCMRAHYECSLKITNVDGVSGNWTFGMTAKVTNGSTMYLGNITRELSPGETGLYNWSFKFDSVEDDASCTYNIVSVPRTPNCWQVPMNRTVTKQECTPTEWNETVVEEQCTEQVVGYVDVLRNKTVIKYRNITRPC